MDEQTKKQPEVELDLDDVNEASVELKEKDEPKKAPNLNVGEVDLGYTNHDNKSEKDKIAIEEIEEQPKVEAKVETKTQAKPAGENLEEYTESVKKRIDKLTYKIREAERREQAALEYAKGLQKKYSDAESKYMDVDTNYIKEFDARVDAQRAQAKSKLKLAKHHNNQSFQVQKLSHGLKKMSGSVTINT
jgi:hypothetical protein